MDSTLEKEEIWARIDELQGALEAAARELANLNNLAKVQHHRITHLENALQDSGVTAGPLPPGRRHTAYLAPGKAHRRIDGLLGISCPSLDK